jgi:hypothetical protein
VNVAWYTNYLTENFRGFPQFVQDNSLIALKASPRPLSFPSSPVLSSLFVPTICYILFGGCAAEQTTIKSI